MNYLDLVKDHTLPERQRSLFKIIGAAQMAADEGKCRIVVIHSPFYVDENSDSLHVFCPMGATEFLFPKSRCIKRIYNIDAVVEPSGSVYFTNRADVLFVLEHTSPEIRRISVSVETK
jgi:hypothetical protein